MKRQRVFHVFVIPLVASVWLSAQLLHAGPETVTFSLSVGSDKVILLQAGVATVHVMVARQAGFDAPIALTLSGLPAGVTAAMTLMSPEAAGTDVELRAAAGAPHSLPTSVTIVGKAAGISVTAPLTVTVRGKPGTVDTSFSGGTVVTAAGSGEDTGRAIVVDADGGLFVAGSSAGSQGTRIAVLHYLRDGAIDAKFGERGRVFTAIGKRNDSAAAIALQQDGKILVAGTSGQPTGLDFVLVRYLPNGRLDTSFGSRGVVTTDFGGTDDRVWAIVIQPDGRIVLGGESSRGASTTGVDFALARYLPDGTLDKSFGSEGRVITAVVPGGGADIVHALAWQVIDGQPRILAVGGEGDFTAARYTVEGVLDSGFGQGGRVFGVFKSNIGVARAVTVLADGTAVLAGHVLHDFALARLRTDGTFDSAFGPSHDGRMVWSLSKTNWDEATAMAAQDDGRILAAGWVYAGNSSAGDFAVVRLAANGTPDHSFGMEGVVIKPVAPANKSDLAYGLALQTDPRISAVRAIVLGEANSSNFDVALLRLWL